MSKSKSRIQQRYCRCLLEMHYRQCDAQCQGARLSLGMMACELGSQL